MKKLSIYGNRRAQNAAKKLGIEIHETRELYNAYGKHYFWRVTDRYIQDARQIRKLQKFLEEKKIAPQLTDKEKITKWCKRLAKLTYLTEAEARVIAKEKIKYKEKQIGIMEDRDAENPSSKRGKLIEKMKRENPLRYITDYEHAYAIARASNRHNNTDYESKLDEGRELAMTGEIDRTDVRDWAKQKSF